MLFTKWWLTDRAFLRKRGLKFVVRYAILSCHLRFLRVDSLPVSCTAGCLRIYSGQAKEIESKWKQITTSYINPNTNRLFGGIWYLTRLIEKRKIVYHNDTQPDEKRTAHSCNKEKLTNQMRNFTIAGHNYILLQALPVHTNSSFIRVSPLVLKWVTSSIIVRDVVHTAECFPDKLNSRYLPDIDIITTLWTDFPPILITLSHLWKL